MKNRFCNFTIQILFNVSNLKDNLEPNCTNAINFVINIYFYSKYTENITI